MTIDSRSISHQQTQPQPVSNATPTHSQSLKPSQPPKLLPAALEGIKTVSVSIKRLCAMKNTVDLTPYALETWAAVLSTFDPTVVNEAVVRIGLSEDPFPDLGKIVAKCTEITRQRNPQIVNAELPKVSRSTVAKVAEALQLKIG